jgi:DNA (cytosine-5)-methyltransferase 1
MKEQLVRIADFFSGIGGFSVGLERAGMETVLFCEIDAKCLRVLKRHWPHVRTETDIEHIDATGIAVDLACGGFPCQPFSSAARGRNNKRDLWPAMRDRLRELRPDWVLAENVPGLGYHGIDRVCGDLEALDYSCWPIRLDTAPPGRHRGRDRFVIVAHANSKGEPRRALNAEVAGLSEISGRREAHDAPPLGMDDGLPGRMDALKQLGNSISPWAAEMFGRAVMAVHKAMI